jgi:hypothetical protein
MKSTAIIAIALIISASLMAVKVSPGIDTEEFREGKYIHLDQVTIKFDKTDAEVSIEYHLSPFAQVYMFLFGSSHLEPKINEIFFNFSEVTIQEIGRTHAKVLVKDISRQSNDYYLHDTRQLGMKPDMLTLVFPDGSRRNAENAKETPNTFYG